MTQIQIDDPARYPIGKFTPPASQTAEQRNRSIQTIQDFPARLQELVNHGGPNALETRYRDGGWTMRQVIHHCADSHMNGYMRFKLAMTEDNPTMKPYLQDGWANLKDARTMAPDSSLTLLQGLHARWSWFLRTLKEEDWNRTFYRPDKDRTVPLFEAVAHYAWHCEHHLAHVRMCVAVAK